MKILVVSGSSGGHIFPALSFIEALHKKQKDSSLLLLLPRRVIKKRIPVKWPLVKYISTEQLGFGLGFKNIPAVFRYLKGIGESFFNILEFKPDLVVGFGSLDSIPCMMLAWFFRIPTLIHEQNVIPGRANKLLAKFSDKIAVSFAQTGTYLNVNAAKIMLTGNPVRNDLKRIDRKQSLDFFGLKEKGFTVLVTGGSQGSSRINKYFFETAKGIEGLQVIHICGANDEKSLKEAYLKANIEARVFAFLNEMDFAYSAADLAVCRAGATTIAELNYFALPAVIVPYPYAYAHQLENARILENQKSAIIVNDKDLESGLLKEKIASCLNRKALNNMRLSYGSMDKPPAAELLAEYAKSFQYTKPG